MARTLEGSPGSKLKVRARQKAQDSRYDLICLASACLEPRSHAPLARTSISRYTPGMAERPPPPSSSSIVAVADEAIALNTFVSAASDHPNHVLRRAASQGVPSPFFTHSHKRKQKKRQRKDQGQDQATRLLHARIARACRELDLDRHGRPLFFDDAAVVCGLGSSSSASSAPPNAAIALPSLGLSELCTLLTGPRAAAANGADPPQPLDVQAVRAAASDEIFGREVNH